MPPLLSAGRALFMGAMLLVSVPAAAQWTGKGEAGLAFADGNTSSRTANARVAAKHKNAGSENSFFAAGLYVRTDGDTTARRWESGAQTRQDFFRSNFWYGAVRYEEDRFSGFDHQGLVTTGVGRRFIESDTTKLLGQVGAGFKFWETLLNTADDSPAEKETSFTGAASLEFEHKFTNTTTLYDKFTGEFPSGNIFLQNEVGVQVKMTNRLALSLAYTVRHNTDPTEGFRKTDTLTTANLVYEVK